MTVAAVIVAATAESALADAAGVSRVRRIADAAWSGGATPVIVVAPDPGGRVAAALSGAPVTLAEPAPNDGGAAGRFVRGIDVALGEISETDAALLWPVSHCWAGPETATSLIEAHGVDPETLLRPAYHDAAGWPVLLSVSSLAALRALSRVSEPEALVERLVAGGGMALRTMDLGDPGSVMDGTTPRDELPAYEGPAEPAARHTHEWGAAAAATPDDAPLSRPSTR